MDSEHTLAPEKAVTPLQMRKIKHLTRNMGRYKSSSEAVTSQSSDVMNEQSGTTCRPNQGES
jgi:hypothetical protein